MTTINGKQNVQTESKTYRTINERKMKLLCTSKSFHLYRLSLSESDSFQWNWVFRVFREFEGSAAADSKIENGKILVFLLVFSRFFLSRWILVVMWTSEFSETIFNRKSSEISVQQYRNTKIHLIKRLVKWCHKENARSNKWKCNSLN